MEVRHIRYFLAVAETLNFTRAAQRLHIAQPPLSLQIRQLEEELGAELFLRSKHKVELTAAGKAFLEYAQQITQLLGSAKQRVAGVARGQTGQLRVAFSGSASRVVLPRLLRMYREHRPDVQILMSDLMPTQQLDALERGDIDIGITRDPVRRVAIDIDPLVIEPMCLVLPSEHRLSTLPQIPSSALAREPMVMCSPQHSPSIYEIVCGLCTGAGFVPNELYQIRAIHSVLDFVAAHEGITILPQGMQTFNGDAVVFRPIVNGAVSRLCLTRLANSPSLLVCEFVELAQREFEADRQRPAVSASDPNAVVFVNDR